MGLLARRGHFRWTKVAAENTALRRYQQSLGDGACRALDEFLATKEPGAKAKANRELEMNIQALRADGGIPEGE